jgi:hypothetical protein
MLQFMLANVICHEFDRVAGQNQGKTGKAMHIGFGMRCGHTTDQYNVIHMYIHAPQNYASVAVQQERIDEAGCRHVGPMEIISYHDSCWRDAIQSWICQHAEELNVFKPYKLFDWNDVIELTAEEQKYLESANNWRRDMWKDNQPFTQRNPFDNRGIWAN